MSELPKKLTSTTDCKQGVVRGVRFNADGNYCLTCGSDKSVKLWNPHRKILLKTYQGHGYDVLDAVSSFDNSLIASCGTDKIAILWDVATGQSLRKFRGHLAIVNSVAFNEEASVILTGSVDSSTRIWDCRSKSFDPVQVLKDAKDSVTSVKTSDYELLTASADGYVRRYDLRNGQMHMDCVGKPVTCVNFTKDGQCMLASSLDSTLRLLDKDNGELLGEYTGHKNSEFKVESCLNHTDSHIVSGSEDGRICFWDLVEGTMSSTIADAGDGVVHSVTFHPTEACMLSAAQGSFKVWRTEDYESEES
ncbi:WD repeat domain-containing protein 83-like [Antedon mediterranea]|uniref:WD repeat domain-containing protein 83-like n=1 Tax=Antedon mediterranea TaxID=105859 RepID=UPI003AF8387A